MNTGTSPSDKSTTTSTNTPSTDPMSKVNDAISSGMAGALTGRESRQETYTPSITNADGSKSPMVPTNSISSKINVAVPKNNEDIPPGKEGVDYQREKPSVNVEGVNPQVKENFQKMATVFKEQTKRPITVTSGFRTKEQQAKDYIFRSIVYTLSSL